MFVLRRKTPDWKEFGGVVTLIVGGSTLTYLVQSGLLAYFWIGIFAGFFANIIAKVLSKWIPNLDPSTVTR